MKASSFTGRRLRREAYKLRLLEDFVSIKVRCLQGGKATDRDCSLLGRAHELALENLAEYCSRNPSLSAAPEAGALGIGDSGAEVVRYDPGWPRLYEAESESLRRGLGTLAAAVHHVGSTSIPGMPAKPLVDLAVSAEPATLRLKLPEFISAMKAIDYRYYGDWGHRGGHYFAKHDGALRTFSAQIHASDSPDLGELLRFRDGARADPGLIQDYARVKLALAAALGRDRGAYFWYKSHWLADRMLADRSPRAWGSRFLRAQYPTMIQLSLRFAAARLRPRFAEPGLHPMAIRQPRRS
jgi:GrpB-like predicted nucleotidyltransferase (UPF0157 family)